MDIDFHQVGYLFLAKKKETWDDLLQGVQIQLKYNVPVEVLSPEEIKYRWPYLRIDDLCGGTFGPEDGYADPYHVVMGYANEARKLGVNIEERTEVISISMKSGKVMGVNTNKGFISSNRVVNNAGPWAGEVARMAGLDLAVKPYRRQVFVITDCEFIPRPVPMIIDVENRSYFRGESADILAGMSDLEEPSSFNLNVDPDFMERVVESLIHRAPDMVRARMLRGWAGLYTITPDDNAIIGRIPELDGFYCAIGFSGHGFQHGPAVGRILSEIILDGHTEFDLSPFAYDRFDKIKKPGEKRVV
jgi:sarcosine oxidase subunit beta